MKKTNTPRTYKNFGPQKILNHWRNGNGRGVHVDMYSHMQNMVASGAASANEFAAAIYDRMTDVPVGKTQIFEANREKAIRIGADRITKTHSFYRQAALGSKPIDRVYFI